MSEVSRKIFFAAALAALAGCGQTGQLYLPETQGEVVTRPTQTPPADTGTTSNSSQSVDSPPAPATPAPEVTEPQIPGDPDPAKKDKKDGAPKPPSDSTPKN